jgi:hypothetical protein
MPANQHALGSAVATLRERCKPGEVDLVIFGRSPHCGLDVLRGGR